MITVKVNLTEEDVEELKKVCAAKGVTMTQAVRRAIAMQKFVDETVAQGDRLLIEQRDKDVVRELVVR